jgi:cell wall-associated NlpC family hydrolase
MTRETVIAEANRWLGTSFHDEARVMGAGVDCGQLLIAVYGACGYMPADYPVEHYPADFAMHRDREWYLGIVKEFAKPIETPLPGDVVLFKLGRLYSHGGIVVDWPETIHAWKPVGKVIQSNVLRESRLADSPRLFFSPFED